MTAIIFSDSHHDSIAMYDVAEKYDKTADAFIHLGDGTESFLKMRDFFPYHDYYCVPGNSEIASRYDNKKPYSVFEIAGKRVLATHGHRLMVKNSLDYLYYAAQSEHADVALFGHTHAKHLEKRGGIIYFNPGSITLPVGLERRSFGVMKIRGGEITLCHEEYKE